jgi:Flp pilus assembly protein TadG
MRSRSGSAERGGVTAEFAVLLPALLLVLAFCLGAVQLVGQQLRLSDAAADAARAAARGDGPARVAALVTRAVPGADLSLSTQAEFVCAELGSAPAGVLASFGARLTASACALAGGL